MAGLVDEWGWVGKIDALIRQDLDQRRVSVGMAVKALILMGLGFTQRALSLTPQLFADKPVERWLGAGLAAEHLNADALGRALEARHGYGVEWCYSLRAGGVVKQLGLSCAGGHRDATGFQVDGAYNHRDEVVAEGVVHIRPGYSRDHRPDLNQGVLHLITENQAGIPVVRAASSGNTNDQTGFRALGQRHIAHLKVEVGLQSLVADSALDSEASLRALGARVWLSRVPETGGAARALIAAVADDLAASTEDTVYRAVGVVAAGVRQRWVVVYSRAARLQAEAPLRRQHLKQGDIELKPFGRLRRQRFACEAAAQAALEAFSQGLTLTEVQAGGIVPQPPHARPAARQSPTNPPRSAMRSTGP